MNTTLIESLTNHTFVLAVGWALIHFLWQASLVGLVLAIGLRIMCRSSAQAKYIFACAGLAVMASLPIATVAYQVTASDESNCQTPIAHRSLAEARDLEVDGLDDRINSAPAPGDAQELDAVDPLRQLNWVEFDDTAATTSTGWLSRVEVAVGVLRSWLPLCVIIWMTGVLLLAIRMVFGVRRVWRWKQESVEVVTGELVSAVKRLSKRMNLSQRVRIFETVHEAVPAVVGWIRPVILVPTSMLSGLTTAELESILAHELAHVRRYDYAVNLLQTTIETMLFYHPAVWWISKRIRSERENCCDDVAIEVCGNRMAFARALAQMEEFRCRNERLAMAVNGGSLIGRIRRILGEESVPTGSWWSAGAMILGSLGLLLCGMWMTVATARPVEQADVERPAERRINDLESDLRKAVTEDKKRKNETILTDSKTKMEQRVFTGIRLSVDRQGELLGSSLAMKYTNVMAYSFIPARLAKQLAATELGEINFGTEAPAKKRPFQTLVKLNDGGLPKPLPVVEPNGNKQLAKQTTYVSDLTKPVHGETKIVPYADDAVWTPGHLSFYGLNQTNQHRFKVVRIDRVALGVGPEFGPVNALVLDDENSEFGLLGMDWIQRVRGNNGEGLWFVAAEGALYFTAGTTGAETKEHTSPPVPAKPKQDRVTVESHGHQDGPARLERPGVKVLATHTYSQTKRSSTGWVEVDRVRLPVDVGVHHDGTTVYQTLMMDIVAVDGKTGKSLWKIDWRKMMPIWETVSIVELDREGRTELAVELYAAVKKTGELSYQYFSLKTGKKLEPPKSVAVDSDQQQDSKPDGTTPLKFQTVEREGDRATRAVISALPHGRSATALVRHFARMPNPTFNLAGSITNRETIVSASKPNYLLVDRMEAQQVLMNLPEGSGLRAEFSGKNIEIKQGEKTSTVIVTDGKIELIDAGGVIRAWAWPDGGAEQLIIECREDLGEVAMTMKTHRIKKSPEYPNPPVQVVMNPETGAAQDEDDPPHGAIRYEIVQDKGAEKQVRMKMKWRYELKRLLEEAKAESGLSAEVLITGKRNLTEGELHILLTRVPQQTAQVKSEPAVAGDSSWGRLAENSGLRSRLTLTTQSPAIGKPLLFKLEVKNFGDKPTGVDAQRYEPFRVLRATQAGGKSAKFIGMTPQTSGEIQQLKPGESLTLWENVDANGLFLLDSGRYKFMAEGGEWATQTLWRDSNTVVVQIAAGEPSPTSRLLKKLGEDLPEKWKVSSGMGLAEGWKGVFLTHAPTSLKRDATGVQIWFTDKQLADDFELGKGDRQQVITQLGRCELGFMNVAAQPRTLDIWPGYLEHIREAAQQSLKFQTGSGDR